MRFTGGVLLEPSYVLGEKIAALDMDDVICVTGPAIVSHTNSHYGMKLELGDFSEDWPKMWGVDIEEAGRRADVLHDEVFPALELVKGALEGLMALKQADIKRVITTSRPSHIRQLTEDWLDNNLPGLINEVRFAGIFDGHTGASAATRTKCHLYRELQPSIVVDDQMKHVRAAADLGMSAVLFSDMPWSHRDYGEGAFGVMRCTNWLDLSRKALALVA